MPVTKDHLVPPAKGKEIDMEEKVGILKSEPVDMPVKNTRKSLTKKDEKKVRKFMEKAIANGRAQKCSADNQALGYEWEYHLVEDDIIDMNTEEDLTGRTMFARVKTCKIKKKFRLT